MHYNVKDLSGQRFGMLAVLEFTGMNERGNALFKCRCDCGNDVIRVGSELTRKRDKIKSCGCYKFNRVDPNRTHKICAKCKIDKSIESFGVATLKPDGKSDYCIECWRVVSSFYRKRKAEYYKKYQREWYKKNIKYRISKTLRRKVNFALHRKVKISKKYKVKSLETAKLISCSIDELKSWLESKFDEHMNWENYGSYWHIDHIKPCAMFDLENLAQRLLCFHYTNLQPLEASENMKKGAKYNGQDFRVWK